MSYRQNKQGDQLDDTQSEFVATEEACTTGKGRRTSKAADVSAASELPRLGLNQRHFD